MTRAAAKPKPPAAAPPDPLADLRDNQERYPEQDTPPTPPPPGEDDPLRTVLGEALGAASMCWEPIPEGVFQSEQASLVLDDLLEGLAGLLRAPVEEGEADALVERWHADTVALGFLHKGGRCGCRYIATIALGA